MSNLDDLREQTERSGRVDDTDPERSFDDVLAEQFEQDDTPSSQRNISTNDADLWNTFQALEQHPERRAQFLDQIGFDPDEEPTRSKIASALMRHAIRDLDPTLKEQIDEAKGGF